MSIKDDKLNLVYQQAITLCSNEVPQPLFDLNVETRSNENPASNNTNGSHAIVL